jgi:predicted ribosomally synthesized peptide with nif11-like leader
MSKESASQLLEAATRNADLRKQFQGVANPDEFVKVASELGYPLTTDELKEVVKEHSEGVTLRRQTGIWPWLRSVRWI